MRSVSYLMNDIFEFQNFSIIQRSSAMKVNTDSVLLGAWADGGMRILDIGTGTGVLGLMMAQRFPVAKIDAIEIDKEACNEASLNIQNSIYNSRIDVFHTSVQKFKCTIKNPIYDSIISNPPFYNNSLENLDVKRCLARHTGSLTYKELLKSVDVLMKKDGVFSVILPNENVSFFLEEAVFQGFFLFKKCLVFIKDIGRPKRTLISLMKRRPMEIFEEKVVLFNHNGEKTSWYKTLTKDFYL